MAEDSGEKRKRRRPWPVELSEEAHDGLDVLASRLGLTRTGLLEALGLLGGRPRPGPDEPEHPPLVSDEVIALAREIDRERRSRR